MRIIGGQWRGRQLATPTGRHVRPTADRVRESLFNILGQNLTGRSFLDLFAGTGAVALEAASRGASPVVAVESNRTAAQLAARNIRDCGAAVELVGYDAARFLNQSQEARRSFDLVFVDPPYRFWEEPEAGRLLEAVTKILAPVGTLTVEHASGREPPASPGLAIFDRRRYGDTGLAFYHAIAPERTQ